MPDTTLLSETMLFAGLGDDALVKVVEAGQDLVLGERLVEQVDGVVIQIREWDCSGVH